jgi:hypothetical protein
LTRNICGEIFSRLKRGTLILIVPDVSHLATFELRL